MKILVPKEHLLNGRPYTPAAHTDVRETWRKHGWTPINPTPPQGTDIIYQQKGTPK
jgi:hypothetical protein